MQSWIDAKQYSDPEKMAAEYLARYYGDEKVEYPINPFKMLKDEGILFSLRDFTLVPVTLKNFTDSGER